MRFDSMVERNIGTFLPHYLLVYNATITNYKFLYKMKKSWTV